MARDAAAALFERLAFAGVVVAGLSAAIVGPLTVAAQRFGEAGEAADRMARRAGVSVETMSELAYVADRVGVSTNDLAGRDRSGRRRRGFFCDWPTRWRRLPIRWSERRRRKRPLGQPDEPCRRYSIKVRGLAAMRAEATALGLTFSGPAPQVRRPWPIVPTAPRWIAWAMATVGQAVAPAIEDWNQLGLSERSKGRSVGPRPISR